MKRAEAAAAPDAGAAGREFSGIQRILLIQLRFLGDVILCTPAIRALRRAYPDAEIHFLTSAAGADLLAGNPHLDRTLVWRPGWRAGWALRRELRRLSFDLVVDFQSMPRTARLVSASRARYRIGVRGRGPRNRSYTHLVPREHRLLYTPLVKLGVLAPLGVEPDGDLSLELVVGPSERARVRELWERCGLDDGRPVVAVSVVSREGYKQWGGERWAEVADGLAAAGAHVLLTSGPGERDQVEAVARQMRYPAVWDYGTTTLRELAAIYQACALWVGNDGGPKHVAAAVGTPTVTVFRWQIWPVWTDTTAPVAHHHVEAPPPGGCDMRCTRCRHLGCLGAVPPERVLELALEQLGRRSGRSPLVQLGR